MARSVLTRSKKKRALDLLEKNSNAAAQTAFEDVLAIDKGDAECWYYLGIVRTRLNRFKDAADCMRHTLVLQPKMEQAWFWLGHICGYSGDVPGAQRAYEALLKINPGHVEGWNKLGKAHEVLGAGEQALACFRRAAQLAPAQSQAHANLGHVLYHLGHYEQALDSYRHALALEPLNIKAALGYHLSLPILYRDRAHMDAARARYEEGLQYLTAHAPLFAQRKGITGELQWNSGFYLAYQGQNDKELQRRFAAWFRTMAQAALPQFMTPVPARPTAGRRIRVGYASHCFSEHTVSHYFRCWIEQADRDRFEIFVYHLDARQDQVSAAIARACDHYKSVSELALIAQTIRADELDILVYPEVGMLPTHQWLAALRLAPIQCVAWGHPETTGLESIDYFLSAQAVEPENGQDHYSERLIRLAGLGVDYPLPDPGTDGTREELGLPGDRHLYLCTQSLFKIHVDTDRLVAEIAAADAEALILFAEDPRAVITAQFKNRLAAEFSRRGLDATTYTRVLPRLKYTDYLRLNRLADVMLDTPHWSGGRTSYDALACGLPIVTLPGALARGRQTRAMLAELDLHELIARDEKEYVSIAIRIGTDRALRDRYAATIRSRLEGRLTHNDKPIRSLEAFYTEVVGGGRG